MPLIPQSEMIVKINKLTPDAHLVRLGDLVLGTEIAGSLVLSGFSDGEVRLFEIDHSAEGSFVDCPLPSFAVSPGFTIEPVLDGTNGSQFRIKVTYTAAEYVYYHGAEPGVGGGDTITFTRRGIVLLDT